MLTVCCVWVKGAYPYTAEYVVRLERMVRRRLQRPFEFVCITDRPSDLPRHITTSFVGTPDARIPEPTRGIWTKLQVFHPGNDWQRTDGRVLFLDLDVLVVAPLNPIVDFPAPFALTEDELVEERAHDTIDRYGRQIVRKFNSSVMVWDGGQQQELYTKWTFADAHKYSTDQDLIADRVPTAAAMPAEWFPRISRVQPPWPVEAKVVLVKKPKNVDAVKRWPWFEPMWGAA